MPPWPSSWILELNDSAILNLHFTPMPPIKFRLNLTFEEFQDGCRGDRLGYRNGTILAILNFCVTMMPPIKFQLNLTGFRRRSFEELQDGRLLGGHLGYPNGMILAILNLCVTVMPPIKFQLNRT